MDRSEIVVASVRRLVYGADMTLGEYMRDAREKKGLGVRELARQIGMSASFVSDVELDRRGIGMQVKVNRWCKLLGLDPEEVMYRRSKKIPCDLEWWLLAEQGRFELCRELMRRTK